MKPKFTTSDFVRPCQEAQKSGYVLEIDPVFEDEILVTFMYTFLNYRSGELCRYAEGDLKKIRKPRDYNNPKRVRVKPLAVGDTVFDCEMHLFAVITDIDKFGFVHLDQSKTLEHKQRHFDCDAELYGATWVVSDTDCLYQLVPDRIDHREGLPICYEHQETQDNYPYYSPYLDENLFLFETERPAAVIPLAPAGSEETIQVYLNEETFPTAFKAKLEELIEQGFSEEDARRWLLSTPIVLELYYEKDSGLFAVESEALESCPESIHSPYSGVPFKENEENK